MSWAWFNVFDDAVLRAVNLHLTRVPAVAAVCDWAVHTGLCRLGLPVVLLAWAWFRRRRDLLKVRGRLVAVLAAALASLVAGRTLALALPFRLRPANRPELDFTTLPGYELGMRTWSAFPSDHAAVAFAFAVGLMTVSRPLGAVALVHAVFVVCAPRLILGLHHPTDLLAGALVGTLLVVAALQPALRDRLAFPVLRFEVRRPHLFYAGGLLLLMQLAVMFDDVRPAAVALFRVLRHGL